MSPLKNNYLTLRSKVKVPQRSFWYATHRLMVMHQHTKYHWPIWKDKKVMVRTSFIEKKWKWQKKKKIRLKQYVSLRSKGRHNNKMRDSFKVITIMCIRRVWRYQRVISICISKKNIQHNDQKKKYKQRSTKHTYKTKDLKSKA